MNFRRVSLLVALVFSIGTGSALAAEAKALSYKITVDQSQPKPILQIELGFTGETDGETELELPSEWAGQEKYYLGIENLRGLTPGIELLQPSPDKVVVHHPAGALIKISYNLKQVWEKGIDSDGFYWPILDAQYFHFFGHAAWIVPTGSAWRNGKPIHIRLDWNGLKDGWNLANSHGADERSQNLVTTLSQFRHAVYLGGDFRVLRFDVKGYPIRVAVRGKWSFSDEEFLDLAERIVSGQRNFFSDYDYPYYLITLIPTERPCCSRGGTGLTNSFAMQSSRNVPNVNPFQHLLSHELFHNWNGRKIEREDPEQLQYWFSEGFTEYYAWKLNLLTGVIDFSEYLREVNLVLGQYHRSPVKNVPNQRILDEFWKNENIQKLPYIRGMLLALRWDSRISAAGRYSLDNFMRDLLKAAVEEGVVVSSAKVERLIRPYLPGGATADLENIVNKGETIQLDSSALGRCTRLEDKMLPTYDLGFDEEASFKLGTITGLRQDSNAYRAGIREGMKLVRLSVQYGDPSREATITIRGSDGLDAQIRYIPAGPDISVPQFVPIDGCEEKSELSVV